MNADANRPHHQPATFGGRVLRRLATGAARLTGLRHHSDLGWPRFEGGTIGQTPPILLVHGFGVDGLTMLQLARRLVRRHHVIVPDLPGFGLHPDHDPASIDFEFLLSAIDDLIAALPLDRPVLVGSSMGGAIAGGYAASRPSSVAGLVVIGPAGIEPPIDTEVFAAAKRDEHLLRVDSLDSFERVYALNFTKPPWMPRFMKRIVAAEASHRAEDHEIILRNLEDLMLGNADRFRDVACPTEIIWGADDRIIHPSAVECWQNAIPSANSTIIESAGHSTMVEKPDEVADIIERLMQRIGDGPRTGD
ncbi:MAG: alpha/beta hydrolase [Phycisphaerales bacterium]|nr:alpha/beta hydrolase [Phycisphaerales bacterium]